MFFFGVIMTLVQLVVCSFICRYDMDVMLCFHRYTVVWYLHCFYVWLYSDMVFVVFMFNYTVMWYLYCFYV